jgi:hypothetical protein
MSERNEVDFHQQLVFLKELNTYINDGVKSAVDSLPKEKYESDETDQIAAALSEAQGQYPRIRFNRVAPYLQLDYADLDAMVYAVRPVLAKNGLSFTQPIKEYAAGEIILETKVWHSSGQWISSRMRILPPNNDVSSYDSVIRRKKRIALESLLGITIEADPLDDDGEVAMAYSRDTIARGTSVNLKYDPREQSIDVITKEQREELEYELAEYPDICKDVLDTLRIRSLADMPRSKYEVSRKRIVGIKNLRNGLTK